MSSSSPPLALPPRKHPHPSRRPAPEPNCPLTTPLATPLSALDTLLRLGFPRPRAERALVATGNRGPQLAADWLLAHVKDPTLDKDCSRTFTIYLCPSEGPLRDQLQTFWDASRTQVGWNGAHNSFPHVTLTSTFQCKDSEVARLVAVVQNVAKDFRQDFLANSFKLEKYHSPNFCGLFVGKREEILLRSLSQELQQALTSMGVSSEPLSTKSFHLTLAYQFLPQYFNALVDLSDALVDSSSFCHWELRLYSTEERFKNHDVFKVVFGHTPREEDELELMIGDFVYVSSEEIKSNTDGWVLGTSWLTGCSGYAPKNYMEQTAETNAWTLHQDISMTKEDSDVRPALSISSSLSSSLERLKGSTLSINRTENPPVDQKAHSNSSSSPLPLPVKTSKGPRRVYISRHGERVDLTFGSWIPFCFDDKGHYSQKDLNMPKTVPTRSSGAEGFLRDCPLTNIGHTQARLVGEAMKSAGVRISHAYASPSLRCVQTCHGILQGLGLENTIKINLEPGLFEWLAWYQNAMPVWMTPEEMMSAGYNIELKYKPFISSEELQDTQETCEQYYTRNFFVTQCILQATEDQGGDVLLVAHGASLDTCTRQMTGESPRQMPEMLNVVRKVPYCSVSCIEEVHGGGVKRASDVRWRKVTPPVAPLTHSSNARYDWKVLNNEENMSQVKK